VKYESKNLFTMTIALNKLLIMKNWAYWHHLKVFVLAMLFLKQYDTSNEKVSSGLQSMNINSHDFQFKLV